MNSQVVVKTYDFFQDFDSLTMTFKKHEPNKIGIIINEDSSKIQLGLTDKHALLKIVERNVNMKSTVYKCFNAITQSPCKITLIEGKDESIEVEYTAKNKFRYSKN